MMDSSTMIGSDFEQASFLLDVLKATSIEGAARAPFFRAVEHLDSSYERGRVLQALAGRGDLSQDSILGVLRAAVSMTSGFETGQVLRALAAKHELSGEARQLYIATAAKLGNYEEGRALAALVKTERR
jgi:hypothetical protein